MVFIDKFVQKLYKVGGEEVAQRFVSRYDHGIEAPGILNDLKYRVSKEFLANRESLDDEITSLLDDLA